MHLRLDYVLVAVRPTSVIGFKSLSSFVLLKESPLPPILISLSPVFCVVEEVEDVVVSTEVVGV